MRVTVVVPRALRRYTTGLGRVEVDVRFDGTEAVILPTVSGGCGPGVVVHGRLGRAP